MVAPWWMDGWDGFLGGKREKILGGKSKQILGAKREKISRWKKRENLSAKERKGDYLVRIVAGCCCASRRNRGRANDYFWGISQDFYMLKKRKC